MTSTDFTISVWFSLLSERKKKGKTSMEKGDKAGKPHAHLEAIQASSIWKCLIVIPSHIPKSNDSWEICRHDKRCLILQKRESVISNHSYSIRIFISFLNILFFVFLFFCFWQMVGILLVCISSSSWLSHYWSSTAVIMESYQGF